MKHFLMICLVLGTFTAHAEGLKRLTTTTCSNEELETTMVLKWDSSVSIIGPVQVVINDEEVNPVIITFENSTGVQGSLKTGEKYSTSIKSDETSRSLLKLGAEEIDLACKTQTKIRLL
jgi:hypothetical protein